MVGEHRCIHLRKNSSESPSEAIRQDESLRRGWTAKSQAERRASMFQVKRNKQIQSRVANDCDIISRLKVGDDEKWNEPTAFFFQPTETSSSSTGVRERKNKWKVTTQDESGELHLSVLTTGVKGKSIQREALLIQRWENTLMFYVLGQQHRSLLWRRHCINTPERFYKVVPSHNNAQQLQDTVVNIHNKHQYRRTLPEQ